MTDFDLFDVLAGTDDQHDRDMEDREVFRQAHSVRPDTGKACPPGRTWCGRCGEDVSAYDLTINHDLGYCGCPVDVDPVFKEATPAPGWRNTAEISTPFDYDALAHRWDRQFYPDCAACGHPWGLHYRHNATGSTCLTYCGCHRYQAPSQPS